MKALTSALIDLPARLAVLGVIVVVAGCGRSGVDRLSIRGEVTHQGQPVPAGQVRFEPNASQGGTGPVGFAKIVDGVFDTRDLGGKGPIPGPVRVYVTGYVSAKAFAPELFSRYKTEVDLSDRPRTLDLEVPANPGT